MQAAMSGRRCNRLCVSANMQILDNFESTSYGQSRLGLGHGISLLAVVLGTARSLVGLQLRQHVPTLQMCSCRCYACSWLDRST